MGLFGHKDERTPVVPPKETVVTREPTRKSGLFGNRNSVDTTTTTNTNSTHRHGLLTRDREDSSITAARQRVASAELAEREADRALLQARAAVREAREQVKRLEREAAEQARLAIIKQKQAAAISNRARPLGRHDR